MAAIKFGTSGWRGIIAEDFTFANARLVCQAIADYLKQKAWPPRAWSSAMTPASAPRPLPRPPRK